jgi:protein subunit release factor B
VGGDLYRMLSRYAERRGFKVEPLETGDGKYTFEIKGDGATRCSSTRAARIACSGCR